MTDDELQQRLEALGRSETPVADPVFADRLESELRAMAAVGDRPSVLGWLLRPSVVVAALAVFAGLAFFVTRSGEATLEFAAAEGTSVSIPGDDELSAGRTGQSIPDGARITVGPEGSATVGGVILDPGTVAIVVNGVVEVIELPPTSVAPSTPPTTEGAPEEPATTTIAPTTSSAPSTEEPVEPAPSTTDAPTTTAVAPTSSVVDDGSTTTSVAPSTTVAPETTTSTTSTTVTTTSAAPAQDVVPPTVTLTIDVGENGRAVLQWTVDGDTSDIAGWVVRRGRVGDSTIAAVIRRPEARRQRVDLPDRNVAWLVVARDADGEVIARSNLVRAN